MEQLNEKLTNLKGIIQKYDKLMVAFSGGIDSTFLLSIANNVLNGRVVAVTAVSPMYIQYEIEMAKEFAKSIEVKHILLKFNPLEIEQIQKNTKDRCYYCKKALFQKLKQTAVNEKIEVIADGTNCDDIKDYRPGLKAVYEESIENPLVRAGFTKQDIRTALKEMGYLNWDRPAQSCLATRLPYGKNINESIIRAIGQAEEILLSHGIRQVRVRLHDDVVRIEVGRNERVKFFSEHFMDMVSSEFKKLGFNYIALDIEGYRIGSMNEVLEI